MHHNQAKHESKHATKGGHLRHSQVQTKRESKHESKADHKREGKCLHHSQGKVDQESKARPTEPRPDRATGQGHLGRERSTIGNPFMRGAYVCAL